MTPYSKTSHTVFHHRYHIVWITKYRFKVLQGNLRMRVREIIAQAADELSIKIVNGVLSSDHVPIFSEIPPHISVSDFVKVAQGRSSHKIQQEFPEIHKKYRGMPLLGEKFFPFNKGQCHR